jgi:signal transduction histidine kinase
MTSHSIFRSIYARFTMIFVSIWWIINTLSYVVVIKVISGNSVIDMRAIYLKHAAEMVRVRQLTGLVFLGSVLLGTILILLAVQRIVKPIKALSLAASQIAQGNFNVTVSASGQDEISKLSADFNQMARSLQNIDILRKDFVANVSHEFKTPITSISGYARLISEGGLPEDQVRDYARLIASESQRLSHLSNNMLRLSELDADLVREQAISFSLDEQIRQSILLLAAQWEPRGIDFDLDLEPVVITTTEHLLQEVWLNIIGNAVKFSPDNSTIQLSLRQENQNAITMITDQGSGINPIDQPRIYERFFAGDQARSKGGNGIGLAIVKKIIDLIGGKISFVSRPGQGTSFSVELPLSPKHLEV